MKIGLASDHRGFALKEQLKEYLKENDYEIVDCGTNSTESVDFTDYAFPLGEKVSHKEVDFGIAICGTGIGISMACNKVNGVRCAKVDNLDEILATRHDNDANIVAFGEKVPFETAKTWIETFFHTPTSMDERHVRRRTKIETYEENRK